MENTLMSHNDQSLDTCGCCPEEPQPPRHYNPPGQERLNYRIGVHGAFFQRMIAGLTRQVLPDGDFAGQKPLLDLTTRQRDDPAVALLDASAVAADILSFYQERIANEGYLRTATERRSLLEMARQIGYELGPGVAATAYLAFTIEEAVGAPEEATIPAGTAVQSIPSKAGEKPQTFETSEEFKGYPAWNKLRPQLTQVQTISDVSGVPQVYIQGTDNRLQPGDMVLLVDANAGAVQTAARRITQAEPDFGHDYTVVSLEALSSGGVSGGGAGGGGSFVSPGSAVISGKTNFTGSNVESLVFGASLSEASLQAKLGMYTWKVKELLSYKPTPPPPGIGVYVFRESAPLFGHNAPRWETLPIPNETRGGVEGDPYKDPWDGSNARSIWEDSQGNSNTQADVYLERAIKGINQDDWVVFVSPGTGTRPAYQVQRSFEASRVDYGLSGKVTGIELVRADGGTPAKPGTLLVRETTAYIKSEQLELAALPVTDEIPKGSTSIILDKLVLGLSKDQPVALSGEQVDAAGVNRSEVHFLKAINHSGGRTTLTFRSELAYGYRRDTLVLSANVAAATHGERVQLEVLGSGQGSKTNQRFRLKKPPLTYVSASTTSGIESSLVVQVDGVQWKESSSLYPLEPDDRAYIVRRDNEGGSTILFGDGKHGARLPSGQENVTATYRSGIGLEGEVEANSLTMLKAKPLGVKEVTNPVEAAGAGEPESMDEARLNAPLTVKTLDRIVSLQDYTDFAHAFAGIGKAQAFALWSGEEQIVQITLASETGQEVKEPLLSNLYDAIQAARDPLQQVQLASFQPRYFHLKAGLLVDEAYRWEDVEQAVRKAIENSFTFGQRRFAQAVTAAEILNLIHEQDRVIAIDLDELHVVNEDGSPVGKPLATVLTAETTRWNSAVNEILPAELLLVNPPGINLFKLKAVP
jgi:hypothetical protein